ncbi:MAG: Fur family transcriptional regulator [Opitutales bacterium]
MQEDCEKLVESALTALEESPLRVTEPRKALVRLLAKAEKPLSSEEIRMLSGEELDLVTVYRNMEVFSEQGIVQSILLENGKQLFELTAKGDHHHHIICRNCHRALRLELCFGGELERYAANRGFEDLSHKIEVFGICSDCAAGGKRR